MNDNYKYVEVLRTFSQVDIAMIKSLLEGNFDYYFKGENFMSVRPLLEPAILMVNENELNEVKTLLADFDLNFLGVSLRSNSADDEIEYIPPK